MAKKKDQPYKTVELPHLRTTVAFYDMSHYPGNPEGPGHCMVMYNPDGSDRWPFEIRVLYQDIEETVKDVACMPIVVHELTHVLQHICERFQMAFEKEEEHMAYIMTYLLDELINGIS